MIFMKNNVRYIVCVYARDTTTATTLKFKYLYTVDVDPTHAATAVNEEDELSVNLPQVGANGLEIGAKVEHAHRVVEDVLVESPVNDINL